MTKEDFTSVTYIFRDGSMVTNPINDAAFTNEKGKKRDANGMHELFQQTGWDLGAKSYSLNHQTDSVATKIVEKGSTRNEIKKAVKDYSEMISMNPEGFKKERNHFQAITIDTKVKSRMGFNLGWMSKLSIITNK